MDKALLIVMIPVALLIVGTLIAVIRANKHGPHHSVE